MVLSRLFKRDSPPSQFTDISKEGSPRRKQTPLTDPKMVYDLLNSTAGVRRINSHKQFKVSDLAGNQTIVRYGKENNLSGNVYFEYMDPQSHRTTRISFTKKGEIFKQEKEPQSKSLSTSEKETLTSSRLATGEHAPYLDALCRRLTRKPRKIFAKIHAGDFSEWQDFYQPPSELKESETESTTTLSTPTEQSGDVRDSRGHDTLSPPKTVAATPPQPSQRKRGEGYDSDLPPGAKSSSMVPEAPTERQAVRFQSKPTTKLDKEPASQFLQTLTLDALTASTATLASPPQPSQRRRENRFDPNLPRGMRDAENFWKQRTNQKRPWVPESLAEIQELSARDKDTTSREKKLAPNFLQTLDFDTYRPFVFLTDAGLQRILHHYARRHGSQLHFAADSKAALRIIEEALPRLEGLPVGAVGIAVGADTEPEHVTPLILIKHDERIFLINVDSVEPYFADDFSKHLKTQSGFPMNLISAYIAQPLKEDKRQLDPSLCRVDCAQILKDATKDNAAAIRQWLNDQPGLLKSPKNGTCSYEAISLPPMLLKTRQNPRNDPANENSVVSKAGQPPQKTLKIKREYESVYVKDPSLKHLQEAVERNASQPLLDRGSSPDGAKIWQKGTMFFKTYQPTTEAPVDFVTLFQPHHSQQITAKEHLAFRLHQLSREGTIEIAVERQLRMQLPNKADELLDKLGGP